MNQEADNPNEARVSVIIPAYKAARTISRAVASVLAQTRPAQEIIVIDDGSPDDIAEALAPFGSAVTLLRQPNGGAASARNRGIEHSTGDFIAFLDADDYWEPEKLKTQLGVFERFPDIGLVAGAYYAQQPEQSTRTSVVRMTHADTVLHVSGREAFKIATKIWTGVVLARRSVIGAERFVSGLEPAEDRDLWVRLISTAQTYWLSEPLATAVLEQNSLSRGNWQRDCSNMLRVVERNRDLLGWKGFRMWRSHTYYRWAAVEEKTAMRLMKLAQSVALWPLPYEQGMCSNRGVRANLLAVSLLRLCKRQPATCMTGIAILAPLPARGGR
jgi:glycosyltransferase involved in cell wall biosynthesis